MAGGRIAGSRATVTAPLGACLAAVLTAVVIVPNLWAPLSPFDGGITSSAATFTLHGQLPYRDYWLLYGPLGGWLLAIPTAIAGPSVLLMQLSGLAVALGQAAIGYLLVRRWAGHFVSLLVGVAAACVPPLFLGLSLAAWSLGLLLALIALYLIFETTASPWLAGFVLGLAFLTRLDVGGYALLAAMAGRNRAQVLAGIALTVAPVLALLLATTPPAWLFDQLVWYPLVAQRQFRGLSGADAFVGSGAGWILLVPTVVVPRLAILAALIGIVLTRPRPRSLIALTAFAILCQFQTLNRPDLPHQAQAALPGILLVGWWFRGGPLRLPRLGALAAVTAACVVVSLLSFGWLTIGRDATYDTALLRAIAMVRRETARDEPIFVGLTSHRYTVVNPLIGYYLADRRAGTRYTLFNPGITNTAPVQEEMASQLAASGTRYLLLDRTYAEFSQGATPGATVLDDFIARSFVVRCDLGPVVIMVRADVAPPVGGCD